MRKITIEYDGKGKIILNTSSDTPDEGFDMTMALGVLEIVKFTILRDGTDHD